MAQDRRDPLIEGPEKWRWPWNGSKDVSVGGPVHASADTVQTESRTPGDKSPSAARLERMYGGRDQAPFWKRAPVQIVLAVALLYHLAPRAALFLGNDNPEAARGVLRFFGAFLPTLFDVDTEKWLVPAASAWLWQPMLAALGAGFLRLVAINSAGRNPVGALWIAAVALAIDTATWLSVGLKLGGQAYSPAEAAALITLLKIEGMVLLGLFLILSLLGRRRLDRTVAG